jgi:hypothetical protein
MPDVRRQDAAVAAATTVWHAQIPYVVPLTLAMPAIHGARLCDLSYPRLSWLDEPEGS